MAALVKYVGRKPVMVDRLYGTHCVWNGKNDVQIVVDEEKARQMEANHPDVYEVVRKQTDAPKLRDPALSGTAPAVIDETIITELNGQQTTLRLASRLALAQYGRDELGLAVEDGHSRTQILDSIVNHYALRDKMIAEQKAKQKPAGSGKVKPINPESGGQEPPAKTPAKDPKPAAAAEGAEAGKADGTTPAPPMTGEGAGLESVAAIFGNTKEA